MIAFAFAAFAAAVTAIGVALPADAANSKVLGKPRSAPPPECPGNCTAFVSATGFQVEARGKKNIFKAPEDGKLVAFSVDVSKPNKDERNFFQRHFGHDVKTRIAVLKRLEHNRFRLLRQSPKVNLNSLLGREQFFTLNEPLKIRKGNILALTVPTWLPALASGLPPSQTKWRASREKGKCGGPGREGRREVKQGRPQQKVGSERKYGCTYNLDRLLYWGYYVPA
jgi:hypothetical protein